jgi:LPS export ABC transporter protein LptC
MRHKGVRIFLLLGIFASLGVVGYKAAQNIWLSKIERIRKDPIGFLEHLPEPTLQLKSFHHTKIEEGRKVWEVIGDEARYLKDEQEAFVKKPRLVFYHKDGQTTEATGNEGHLFFKGKEIDKMQLQGDIEVNHQGFVLRTDELVYFKSANQIVSAGKITLKGNGIELEGVGAEFALQEQRFRLLQKVKTKLQPGKLEKIKLGPNAN